MPSAHGTRAVFAPLQLRLACPHCVHSQSTDSRGLRCPLFGPSGAAGCSHGWSDAALSVAQPVDEFVSFLSFRPEGAEERNTAHTAASMAVFPAVSSAPPGQHRGARRRPRVALRPRRRRLRSSVATFLRPFGAKKPRSWFMCDWYETSLRQIRVQLRPSVLSTRSRVGRRLEALRQLEFRNSTLCLPKWPLDANNHPSAFLSAVSGGGQCRSESPNRARSPR
jgi:hypothetical protein